MLFPESNFNLVSWEILGKNCFTGVLFRGKKARLLPYSTSHSIGCLESMRCMTSQHSRHVWANQFPLVRGKSLDKMGTSISH